MSRSTNRRYVGTHRAPRAVAITTASSVAALALVGVAPVLPGGSLTAAAAPDSQGQSTNAAPAPSAAITVFGVPSAGTNPAEAGQAGQVGEAATPQAANTANSALAAPPAPIETDAQDASNGTSRSQTGRVIQVRQNEVRLLLDGSIIRQRWRPSGPLTLTELTSIITSPAWLSVADGQADLKSALYLDPGTTLKITGAEASTLRLQQSASGLGGSIYGSGATLIIDGVNVTGWDAQQGAPAAASQIRPFISLNKGSTMQLRNANFDSLGRPGTGQSGVSLYDGSSLNVLRSTFTRSIAGLTSVRTTNNTLDRVTARSNAGAGVSIRAGKLSARSTTAESNAGPGLAVEGSPGANIWSVLSQGNRGPGVSVRTSNSVTLDRLRLNNNGAQTTGVAPAPPAAGLSIARSSRVTVTDTRTWDNTGTGVDVIGSHTVNLTGTDSAGDDGGMSVRGGGARVQIGQATITNPDNVGLRLAAQAITARGVTVSGGQHGIILDDASNGTRLSGSRVADAVVGMRIAGGSTGDVVTDSTVERAAQAGIDVGGHRTEITDVAVTGAPAGVVVRAGSQDVQLLGLVASETGTGIRVQENTTGTTIRNASVTGGSWALDSSSPGVVVDGAQFTDVTNGVKVIGPTTLTAVDVLASHCGIRSVGTPATVTGGSIRAPRASCGDTELSQDTQVHLPNTPRGLGLFAGGMVTLAVVYESVRSLRERRRDPKHTPRAESAGEGGDGGSGEGEAPGTDSQQLHTRNGVGV